MKKILFLITLICVLFSSIEIDAKKYSSDKLKKKVRDKLFYNTSQGREFWIGFPPNDIPTQPNHIIEIYVTSGYDTDVTVEVPGTGFQLTKPVKAFDITAYTSADGTAMLTWEVRESEQVISRGIHITAPKPISVYCYNGRTVSSEGYLAIPFSQWGKKYIHNSYYDYLWNNRPWATGFMVIGGYQNTRVTMTLRGIGKGNAKTKGGYDIGDVITTKLDAGQVYTVEGDATTRGMWDISGSGIVSDKPVGLISYQHRTLIPSFECIPGFDHIVEMIPPVNTWGKKFTTVEYKRDTDKGDFFRIVAHEPNTTFKCTYYDKNSGVVLGNQGPITLRKEGDFYEYWEGYATNGSPGIKCIRGASVWEADKPVLLCQYAYSHLFDNQMDFDPFMIIVTPDEQYIDKTIFQTPDNREFVNNWFNIIAEHDTTDLEKNDLRSIEIDGEPVWIKESSFLFNRIPTTNKYWAKVRVNPGAHMVLGDTKFAGYIYGFRRVESYGWPAATAYDNLKEVDTLEPELIIEEDCGDYTIDATELRNGEDGDNPKQVDTGIEDVQLLGGNYNYRLVMNPPLIPWPPVYEYSFSIEVINRNEPAFAIYAVTDRVFNVTIDSCRYEPDSLKFDPSEIAFGNVRVNTSKQITAQITNISTKLIRIDTIQLQSGAVYTIISGGAPPGFDFASGEVRDVVIEYTPKVEGANPEDIDLDSLEVRTGCMKYIIPVTGRGVLPRLVVEDWNAGAVPLGSTACKTESSDGLRLENVGTDTLEIYDVDLVTAPFTISDPTVPPFTFIMGPGEIVYLTEICFTPSDSISYNIDVTFKNNGEGPDSDSVSNWQGRGIAPGPRITDKDWSRQRRLTVNNGELIITNSGNTPITVNSVDLDAPNPNFEIIHKDIYPGLPFELHQLGTQGQITEIKIPVVYTPQTEATHHAEVVPVFEGDEVPAGSVRGNLDGIGFEPHIEVIGYEFIDQVKKGDTSLIDGFVTVKNTSTSEKLYIEFIEWVVPGQKDFYWNNPPVMVNMDIDIGDTRDIPVRFTPQTATDPIIELVHVKSDALPGPDRDPRVIDTAEVIGHSFDTGIEVGTIDYGMRLLCDNPELTFTIKNKSSSNKIIIDNISLPPSNTTFTLIQPLPTEIPVLDQVDVTVKFDPAFAMDYLEVVTIDYHFENFGPETAYSEVKGTGYIVPVELNLSDIIGMAPGMSTSDEFKNFPVQIISDNFEDANITSFIIELQFVSGRLSWVKNDGDPVFKGSALDNTWTLTGSEKVDINSGMTKLVITGSGTNPISKSGDIAFPKFLILLSDTSDVPVEFGNISFGTRDACVNYLSRPGSIQMTHCVQDLRSIIYATENYLLYEIEPNPVTGDHFTLNYNIGLKGRTIIELWNTEGDLIEVLIDEFTRGGRYEKEIPVAELSSGVYFIRIKSGPFSEIKRLVIYK